MLPLLIGGCGWPSSAGCHTVNSEWCQPPRATVRLICYGTQHLAEAEATLPRRPIDPTAAMKQVASLNLAQVATIEPLSAPLQRVTHVGDVIYFYGSKMETIAGHGSCPALPLFARVDEGTSRSVRPLHPFYVFYREHPPHLPKASSYRIWNVQFLLPRQGLLVSIRSNMGKPRLLKIAEEMSMRA